MKLFSQQNTAPSDNRANGLSDYDHTVSCTVDIGLTEEELEQPSWRMQGSFELMPASGPGFVCYGPPEKRYGRPEVIQALKNICTQWAQVFPEGPCIGMGNLSLAGGRQMHPHQSHARGLDVDLAPVASTEEKIPLTWEHPKYSRPRTQQLVDLIRQNSSINVRTILFNDPHITGVTFWPGHDHQLHVSFLPFGMSPVAHSSDQQADLRLVVPHMQGARVRKLQEDLIAVGIDIEVDDIFGLATRAAVRQFQSDNTLTVDGIAGKITLAKLAQINRGMSRSGGTIPSQVTLKSVIGQNRLIPFDSLHSGVLVDDQAFCRKIQTILSANGLLKVVDGLYGPKTREAIRRFKDSRQLSGGDVLGPTSAKALLEARPGAGKLPNWQGGDRKATIQAIITEARRQGITDKSQLAYILATVKYETNDSFQPVREAYCLGEPKAENYRQTLRYYPFYGRGYVQLTWDYNYREYANLLGLDLINLPDLVMCPDIALIILIDGMKRGVFTGVKLNDYITGNRVDFYNARRIINHTDAADLIEDYALAFQRSLA